MIRRAHRHSHRVAAFTLIELLVVISIIALLISILMPSLSRARSQAKGVHCLARLKEFGNALAAYENTSGGALPSPQWAPDPNAFEVSPGVPYTGGATYNGQPIEYGWSEILFTYVYQQEVKLPFPFPVQRNIEGNLWEKYFVCGAVGDDGPTSGSYRVYLPSWGANPASLDARGRWNLAVRGIPYRGTLRGTHRELIRPKMPLIGDANEFSERGDGLGVDDCSYIEAGEANFVGTDGNRLGNRFSDRHYGGTNYLFQDLHASWDTQLRNELARDFDLNGVIDIDVQP